jgi:hypothetical protein
MGLMSDSRGGHHIATEYCNENRVGCRFMFDRLRADGLLNPLFAAGGIFRREAAWLSLFILLMLAANIVLQAELRPAKH